MNFKFLFTKSNLIEAVEINYNIVYNSQKLLKTDEVYTYDQFYTKEYVAIDCINKLSSYYNLSDFDLIVEPSAGTGAFCFAVKNNETVEKAIRIEFNSDHYKRWVKEYGETFDSLNEKIKER